MFKKLISYIPYTKGYKEKMKIKREHDLHRDLYLLRDSFENAVSYNDVFNEFERILNNPSTSLENKFIVNNGTKVSFLTKTSQNALDLINNKVYDYNSLKHANDHININGFDRPYIYWESNKESVLLLYRFMKDMISKASTLGKEINTMELEYKRVTEEEEIFINSILFRYLCSDFIQLLIVYVEEGNEYTKEK